MRLSHFAFAPGLRFTFSVFHANFYKLDTNHFRTRQVPRHVISKGKGEGGLSWNLRFTFWVKASSRLQFFCYSSFPKRSLKGKMSSSATVRVEKATSDLLLDPDWAMNMEICDSINLDPGLAKDVVKAVKKRLQHKSPRVQFLALTLLETMVKNCGDFFHSLVVDRDILPEMVKIVRKKTDMEVRSKILVLLDSWQEAFGGPGGKYPQYFWAYTDLKGSGVEFPHSSGDASLIFTSPMHHTAIPRHPQAGYVMSSNLPMRLDQAMASEMSNLSLSDLVRIRSVMELLNDMLKAVNPHDREAIMDEVITDLVDQCRTNKKMILQLIDSTGDEELLGQGLALNDNLQSLLAKHDAIISGSPLPYESPVSIPGPSTPLSTKTAVTNKDEDEEEEEDDEFSRLARRNSKINPPSKSTSAGTTDLAISTNNINVKPEATANTNEVTSSMGSNALALPDPQESAKTAIKEQNIIDLLSITSSSNRSPPYTITPYKVFHQNGTPELVPTNGHGYPHNPQTYPENKGHIPYRSHVASWAQLQLPSLSVPQQHPQPQPQLHFRSEEQLPQPQYLPQQQLNPQHQVALAQYSSYPPPPWEDAPSPNPFTQATYGFPTCTENASSSCLPAHASTTVQHVNSFEMSSANTPVVTGARAGTMVWPAGFVTSPKPFVPSYRLFEDLVDTRNFNGVLKASSATGPGIANGRK